MTLRTEPIEIVTEMLRIYPNFFAECSCSKSGSLLSSETTLSEPRTFLKVRSRIFSFYELSCLVYELYVVCMDCHIYELWCLWLAMFLNCVYELLRPWNVASMNCRVIDFFVYELSCLWLIVFIKCMNFRSLSCMSISYLSLSCLYLCCLVD